MVIIEMYLHYDNILEQIQQFFYILSDADKYWNVNKNRCLE